MNGNFYAIIRYRNTKLTKRCQFLNSTAKGVSDALIIEVSRVFAEHGVMPTSVLIYPKV